jgi:hypothetical protein
MTTDERVRELIVWSETAGVQPFTIEDVRRNVFDRLFRELVEWADEHPELFDVEDKINI